jgi:hypothetical protein
MLIILCKYADCHYAIFHTEGCAFLLFCWVSCFYCCAECRHAVVMMSVAMLSVPMHNVILLIVVVLNVKAPKNKTRKKLLTISFFSFLVKKLRNTSKLKTLAPRFRDCSVFVVVMIIFSIIVAVLKTVLTAVVVTSVLWCCICYCCCWYIFISILNVYFVGATAVTIALIIAYTVAVAVVVTVCLFDCVTVWICDSLIV